MKSLLFLLLIVPAVAQVPATTQSCPVTVVSWSTIGVDRIAIQYVNNSDKKLDAYKFRVQYVDDFGEPLVNNGYNVFEHEHMGNPAKPGGHKESAIFETYTAHRHGWAAVEAIRFKDGSVWKDDGSLSCRGIDWYRQHGK